MEVSRRHILLAGPPGCGKTTLIQKLAERLEKDKVPTCGFYTEAISDGATPPQRIGFDAVRVGTCEQAPDCPQRRAFARLGDAMPKVGKYSVDLGLFEDLFLQVLGAAGKMLPYPKNPRLYDHAEGYLEIVDLIKQHEENEGGGVTIFVPSLNREKNTETSRIREVPEDWQPGSGDMRPPREVIICDEIGKMPLLSTKFDPALTQVLDAGINTVVLGTIPMQKGQQDPPSIIGWKKRDDVRVVKVSRGNRDTLVDEVYKVLRDCLLLGDDEAKPAKFGVEPPPPEPEPVPEPVKPEGPMALAVVKPAEEPKKENFFATAVGANGEPEPENVINLESDEEPEGETALVATVPEGPMPQPADQPEDPERPKYEFKPVLKFFEVPHVELMGDELWFCDADLRKALQERVKQAHLQNKIIVGNPVAEIQRIYPGGDFVLGAGAVLRLGGSYLGGFGEADINYAYRQLSRALHPDKNRGVAMAPQAFKRLSEAADELRQSLTQSRTVLTALRTTMGGSATPDMLERPQQALFAEAAKLLYGILAVYGEGEMPFQMTQRALSSFQKLPGFGTVQPQLLLSQWFDQPHLLDIFASAPIRNAYDCAPKRYRASFICCLNRAIAIETKRNASSGGLRPGWEAIMNQYPEIGFWKELKEKLETRVWTADETKLLDKLKNTKNVWESDHASPWADNWRDQIEAICRKQGAFVKDGKPGACVPHADEELRTVIAELWNDVAKWAKEIESERPLVLFAGDKQAPAPKPEAPVPALQIGNGIIPQVVPPRIGIGAPGAQPPPPPPPDEAMEEDSVPEWSFIPATDLLLVVCEGMIGVSAEGVFVVEHAEVLDDEDWKESSLVDDDVIDRMHRRRLSKGKGKKGKKGKGKGGPKDDSCFRCGGDHLVRDCPFPNDGKCRYCGREGHEYHDCPDRVGRETRSKGKGKKGKGKSKRDDPDFDWEKHWRMKVASRRAEGGSRGIRPRSGSPRRRKRSRSRSRSRSREKRHRT